MQPRDSIRYSHVARMVYETIWAILPGKLDAILAFLEVKMAGGSISDDEIAAVVAGRRTDPTQAGSVAVLPIYGVISQRASMVSNASGGTSIDAIRQQFRQAMANPSIGGIVLDIDSPGGAVGGVDEMATEIAKARGVKPVAAVANTLAASAAYWLGSAASELYVTPSGEVGSIGVFAAHDDISRSQEAQGVRTTLISAGKYKVEGSPYAPLGDEARAAMQSRVNDYYAAFTRAVAKNRGVDVGTVRGGYGEGRVVGAPQARTDGMVDGVATLDDVIGMMARQVGSQSPRAQAMESSTDYRRRRLRLVARG